MIFSNGVLYNLGHSIFNVIGKSQMFNWSDKFVRDDMSAFWSRCHKDGTVKELYKMSHNTVNGGMVFGVCYGDITVEANQFPYLIAATYENGEIPVGYSMKEIPEYTWAICRKKDVVPFWYPFGDGVDFCLA